MQPTFFTSSLLALALISLTVPVSAKPRDPPPSKAPVHAMVSAKAAFEARSIPRLLQAEQALRQDPLRIWPAYWRSQLVVTGQPFSEAAQQAVKDFSETHQGHVLVRALYRDWGVAALQSAP
jgi:hypothetical protein